MVWTSDPGGTPRLAHSLVTLMGEVNTRWPDRDRASDGSIGDRSHRARRSDHNPDDAGLVRAVDIDDDDTTPGDEGIGRAIAEHIRARRDPRVAYLIYHGQICTSWAKGATPAWQWRPYSGSNPHTRHLHVSARRDPRADDPGPWGLVEVEEIEEDDMRLVTIIRAPGEAPHPQHGRHRLVTSLGLPWVEDEHELSGVRAARIQEVSMSRAQADQLHELIRRGAPA